MAVLSAMSAFASAIAITVKLLPSAINPQPEKPEGEGSLVNDQHQR